MQQEGYALASAPSLSALYNSLEQSPPDNARLERDRVLAEVSTPAWRGRSAGVSESEQAQRERSAVGVTVVQRSADLDDPLLNPQGAPMSQAAAVWEDIVEVRAVSLHNRTLHTQSLTCAASVLQSDALMVTSQMDESQFAVSGSTWCNLRQTVLGAVRIRFGTGLLWLGLTLLVHTGWSPPEAEAGGDTAASRDAARQAARVAFACDALGRNSGPALG